LAKAVSHISEVLGQNFSSVDEILEVRKQARAEKNWDVADKIRIAFDECGILVKDTKDGTVLENK
jgi:cysteinyl-tRNA synthetase